MIRSNIFLPQELDEFVRQQSKALQISKTELFVKALREFKKASLRAQMKQYYASEENQKHEKNMIDEWIPYYTETLEDDR